MVELLDSRISAYCLSTHALLLQSKQAGLADSQPADFLRGDEARLLQDAAVLLHAREANVEFRGELPDRSVVTSKLLPDAASRGVRKRGEMGIEAVRRCNSIPSVTAGPLLKDTRPTLRSTTL